MSDKKYMQRALDLAQQAKGDTSPNPLVGAVIVKEGQIIAEGYHHQAGGNHAEINALQDAEEEVAGATMYVNLEPCTHFGKTPPCSNAIIEAGLSRVVIAMKDPNPKISGAGVEKLRQAGIEVEVGILEAEAKKLNEVFIKYITTDLPFVILKNAMTLDGKIATKTGDSRWISGSESREIVHRLRDQVDGILVGIGTVLSDNPRLTTRLPEGGSDPTRIILDSQLEIPLEANLITQDSDAVTIIVTTNHSEQSKKEKLINLGVKILELGTKEKIDLNALLKELAHEEITSLLVEGGSEVNSSFWEEKLVDKIYYFIAPKIIGGTESVPVVGGSGVEKVKNGVKIIDKEIKQVGEDLLIVGYPEYNSE
ncbi:bifunctional diaminohydroxyphosphoribosylaminopyrimidine deaminase/5-amino-6-(5-phosphoribosylamino)uracil reductase RibD [Halanaerobacter jeridensis]|uniref:Riboflavin biosynthesis protein RibD n=1 Tax=Halanaerobacter jeridensis TaxID=706427 RepID=A0A939BPS1_9FIRM|nr:bifunctional diaminohydroxyphosphoribosylaminopyrimidine deaminase/5-amino-6-(5-phosphoribosylamino)uracil reductase RibD [Halanaerobacter jeridensis]MBM7555519.1 diaminohydroxyphosphoribosylaminopyrimidine deaminase/5-amino-6-(5-phosphoribosylamino)uracil reductase [Halanaerobacter jeridensis]